MHTEKKGSQWGDTSEMQNVFFTLPTGDTIAPMADDAQRTSGPLLTCTQWAKGPLFDS